jgi:hypothetical protein
MRTVDPSGSVFKTIFWNSSTVCIRDCAVTVALSICPCGEGRPPTSPAATSLFCAVIAEITSLGISDIAASRCGLSQMRIACGAPKILTSPTPSTRDSGSWMFDAI